eukprot:358277-Chlamydomonas_euryale.AAC.3
MTDSCSPPRRSDASWRWRQKTKLRGHRRARLGGLVAGLQRGLASMVGCLQGVVWCVQGMEQNLAVVGLGCGCMQACLGIGVAASACVQARVRLSHKIKARLGFTSGSGWTARPIPHLPMPPNACFLRIYVMQYEPLPLCKAHGRTVRRLAGGEEQQRPGGAPSRKPTTMVAYKQEVHPHGGIQAGSPPPWWHTSRKPTTMVAYKQEAHHNGGIQAGSPPQWWHTSMPAKTYGMPSHSPHLWRRFPTPAAQEKSSPIQEAVIRIIAGITPSRSSAAAAAVRDRCAVVDLPGCAAAADAEEEGAVADRAPCVQLHRHGVLRAQMVLHITNSQIYALIQMFCE